MSSRRTIACVCSIVAFVCGMVTRPAHAQFTGRFAVSMSFAPPATEGYSAADIVVFHSTATGGGGVVWSAAQLGLGLIANANVDAFSDGTDILVPPTVATCTDVVVEYAVSAASTGTSGSLIAGEKAGNGASSDVFAKLYSGSVELAEYLANDHQNILPGSQIDALTWQERAMYPVFYSVDGTTATALVPSLGPTMTKAAILKVNSAGVAPIIFKDAAALGLDPDDDVDALAVDFYQNGTIVISLKAGSPSLNPVTGTDPFKTEGPGALYYYDPGSATPKVFKKAAELDLAPNDDLTAVQISDPCLESLQVPFGSTPIGGVVDGNEPSPVTPFPWNFETIKVDNFVGNTPRQVWIKSASPPHTIQIETQFPNQAALVFVGLGKVCWATALYLPVAKGVLGFAPLPTLPALPLIFPGKPGATISLPTGLLPNGLFIDLQGVVYDPSLPVPKVFMTNLVTLVTVP